MPYENYMTEDEFHRNCAFWAVIEKELNSRYHPNPWVFKYGCRPHPFTKEYAFTYRNFDNSNHVHFQVSFEDGTPSFHFPGSR